MNKTFYYARVSSPDQNEIRQIRAFMMMSGAKDERDIIIDKHTGDNLDRAGYQALKNSMLRNGDTLIVKELERFSRNKEELKNELEYFKANNITIRFLDIPTTMIEVPENLEWVKEMINNILIEVMGSMAQEERKKIRKRQREGIDIALEKGLPYGRPRIEKPNDWANIISQWKNKKITAVKAMKLLNLKKSTFYKLVKEYTS